MSGLVNWGRLFAGLVVCFAIAFTAELMWTQTSISARPFAFSWSSMQAFYNAFRPINHAAEAALAFPGAIFGLFAKWGWRHAIFRKLGFVNYPDLSGTWHATSYPALWHPFTTVVTIDHSFFGLEMMLMRSQSIGMTFAATLRRTDTHARAVRLYASYYSYSGRERALHTIPAVDHGGDHNGALFLNLNDDRLAPQAWVLRGQYWTTKRRIKKDDTSRGTFGEIVMHFHRRKLAPAEVKQFGQEDRAWLEKLLHEESAPT